ncbi:MAG: hypothetical protein ACLPXB_17060 [Thiobacillaceae bacterium]
MLLADQVGKPISLELQSQGCDARVMKDCRWNRLSKQLRVYCISDLNQDAVLLADATGRLVFNRTDASHLGWANRVRSIIKRHSVSFMLGLSSCFGDAAMINFIDADDQRVPRTEVVAQIGIGNAHRTEIVAPVALFSSAECMLISAIIQPG